ncbi:response regulator [Aeromicrobium chenweiae]|uniref:DNA-binding response regulator n=1 Tax=Aeromicrobium chenweiae TaxID=2079793 RepID=A0A2S0WLP7_9ACTN|nr:response regulator transcription factor [Aeromicrobium chenweiae]AWB92268.1 DNA-binding response regulator [Aeromicrobium chenweiae]TGN31449.1 response regulator transcription factor [Aeromicrobium chenweiae]
MNTIRVLIVDDQAMIRSGIRALLQTSDTVDVVGEAADGRRAVSMARALSPDVILMDLRMPILDGVGAITELRGNPATAATGILVLTTFDTDDNVIDALKAGANGFLGKSADYEELLSAVNRVAAGGSALSAMATDSVVGHLAATAAAPTRTHDPASEDDLRKLASLTTREREVVTLVARGFSNDAIAGHLFISPMTAKTHVNRAMSKMHVSDRAQLVVAALRAGVLDDH